MRNNLSGCIRWGGLLIVLLASACGKQDESSYQPTVEPKSITSSNVPATYRFAAVPEGSQLRVAEAYGPLVDYLNARLDGAKLVLIAPRNYAELEGGLRARAYELALGNALQVVQSNAHGYHVIAKKADDSQFYGILLVRRDSGIRTVNDLKGKQVCYPSPTGVAATMLTKHFLKSQGLDVARDIENCYAGSHEASILRVYSGKAAAGTAREFSWQAFQQAHPKKAADLEVKWKTEPLIDQAIIVRDDLPKALTDRIVELLSRMHETGEGRAALSRMSSSKFESANDATYENARNFFSENADLLAADNRPTTDRLQKEKMP